jgi:hypothetical protein
MPELNAPHVQPWGWFVGHWSGARALVPALVPTAGGTLLLGATPLQADALAKLAEVTACSFLDGLPHRGLQVHLLDFAIRKRFGHLAELAPLGAYRVHNQPRAAREALAELEALARHRHHELLNADTPTLDAYHAEGRPPQPYQLLLVNLDDLAPLREECQRLEQLMDAGADAGILVLGYTVGLPQAEPETQAESAAPSASALPLWQRWATHCPRLELSVDGQQLKLLPPATGPAAPDWAALARWQAHHAVQLCLPQGVPLGRLVQHRHMLAQQGDAHLEPDFLSVPVGLTLDGRHTLHFEMGARSGCHHALVVGMSGSGKTTLLNHLLVEIAERYTADELRLYLMDYKDGVELQLFRGHPNCEHLFLDNRDTEAARTLLQQFGDLISQRAGQLKAAGVRSLHAWNTLPAETRPAGWQPMPHVLLVVDEAQCLLEGPGAAATTHLLTDVAKRGRSFGVHLMLLTQTLVNSSLPRDLMGQIQLRVAFKLIGEADCERIFGSNNYAPRSLQPLQFVYNTNAGVAAANLLAQTLPFQSDNAVKARLQAARDARPPGLSVTAEVVQSLLAALPAAGRLEKAPGIRPGAGHASPLPPLPFTPAPAAPAWQPAPLTPEQQAQRDREAQFLQQYSGQAARSSLAPVAASQPEPPATGTPA